MQGVDRFEKTCTVANMHAVRIPRGAVARLAAANLDFYRLDIWPVAFLRYMGVPLGTSDACKATRAQALCPILRRVQGRRQRPISVLSCLTTALTVCIRHNLPVGAENILPHFETMAGTHALGILTTERVVVAVRCAALLLCAAAGLVAGVLSGFVPFIFWSYAITAIAALVLAAITCVTAAWGASAGWFADPFGTLASAALVSLFAA